MRRFARWLLLSAVAVALGVAGLVAYLDRGLTIDVDPAVLGTMRADPMATFEPPQALRQTRSLAVDGGDRGTAQTVARIDRSFLVPAAASAVAFRDTLRAARAAGWNPPNKTPADRPEFADEFDYREAGKTTIPGRAFTLELILRTPLKASDRSGSEARREITISLHSP